MKNNVIIYDYSNLAKRCLYTPYVKVSETEVDYQMWKYMVWNSIFHTTRKLKATEVVLVGDKHSWRKIIYPAYKMDRRLRSKKNALLGVPDINWTEFYQEMDNFGYELSEALPFKFIIENNCEADDIIGVVTSDESKNYTIVSVDCDYSQLTTKKNIKQWDPIKKSYVSSVEDLDYWVNFNSLRGQQKDNIYNVFTPEDFPIEKVMLNEEFKGTRKPQLTEKKVETILNEIGLNEWLTEIAPKEARKKNDSIAAKKDGKLKIYYEEHVKERFEKNKKLIDFREIPNVLKERITKKYQGLILNRNDDFYPFFKKMGWTEVLENYTFYENSLYNLF